MKHWSWGLIVALAFSFAAAAATANAPAELSMLITGHVIIAPDGRVQSHVVDHAEKLTPAITAVVDNAAGAWKFEPVQIDGRAVTAKANMYLRLVATPLANGQFIVRISGASFGANSAPDGGLAYTPRAKKIFPRYPPDAIRARAGGTVYLVIKVGHDGTVLDAVAQQVNLTVRGNARQMGSLRNALAEASLDAARRWTFEIPASGPHAHQPWWVAHVPVTYALSDITARPDDLYGQWQAYVPGPVESVPWEVASPMASENVDSVPSGAVFANSSALRLLGPAAGG
ncbi:MAG: energy transducer TonB [Rhodanobacter sp.]